MSATIANALARGALEPIRTRCEVVVDSGVAFVVRIAEALARKPAGAPRPGQANPFLPPDPDLVVADLSPTHVAVLNKFPVIEDHLLIVTRAFEEQTAPLTRADFEALAPCLVEMDAIAFYNSGVEAGASQRHKHLQVVPRRLGPGDPQPPIEALLGRDGAALPFAHAFRRVAPGAAWHACYLDLLREMGLSPEAPAGYNLLVTREWMLLVPRTREKAEGISINALGFAGALLARDDLEAERIRKAGPMRLLESVCSTRS
jgi:sulfate adenylyltransferase (ADP) / ATP adenylyltransferase